MSRGITTDKNSGIPEHEQYHQEIYQQQPYPPLVYYHPPQNQKKKFPAVKAIVATVAIVVPTVVVALLYLMVIGLAPSGCGCPPIGTFGEVDVVDPTSVMVTFGRFNNDPRPTDLEIILMEDGGAKAVYSFPTNGDGELIPANGAGVGIIEYEDLANNQKINVGDELLITSLKPDSDYTIWLIWEPTGDEIMSTTFSTTA